MKFLYFSIAGFFMLSIINACSKPSDGAGTASSSTGLKIAYVNGDTVLHKFAEFRKQSDVMEAKQRKAEAELQAKGDALQKEIVAYQQKAKSGVLTAKEMEAREKYLGSRQDELLAERDQIAKEIMAETDEINKRLQGVLHSKLDEIKKRDGYDFILSYVDGGAILAADEKYNITDQVLKMLNEEAKNTPVDTSSKK